MADVTAAGTRHAVPLALGIMAGAAGYLVAVLAIAVAPGAPISGAATAVAAAAAFLLVAGPVGIVRSGSAGPGRVARAGAATAGAGWVLVALGYAVSAAVGADAVVLYATGTGLIFFGMLVAGIEVVRARLWRGAGRWAPLACALYLLPTAPTFGRDDTLSAVLLAGWMLPWLVLGAALLRARSA